MTENKGCRAERSRLSRRRFNAKAAGGIFRIRWPHPDGNHGFKRRTLNAQHATSEDLPAEGLEPTRPCGHWILSPARLPIPPRRLFTLKGGFTYEIPSFVASFIVVRKKRRENAQLSLALSASSAI